MVRLRATHAPDKSLRIELRVIPIDEHSIKLLIIDPHTSFVLAYHEAEIRPHEMQGAAHQQAQIGDALDDEDSGSENRHFLWVSLYSCLVRGSRPSHVVTVLDSLADGKFQRPYLPDRRQSCRDGNLFLTHPGYTADGTLGAILDDRYGFLVPTLGQICLSAFPPSTGEDVSQHFPTSAFRPDARGSAILPPTRRGPRRSP